MSVKNIKKIMIIQNLGDDFIANPNFENATKLVGAINKSIYGVNPFVKTKTNTQYHTELGECTSNCRREGCPEINEAEEDQEYQSHLTAEEVNK